MKSEVMKSKILEENIEWESLEKKRNNNWQSQKQVGCLIKTANPCSLGQDEWFHPEQTPEDGNVKPFLSAMYLENLGNSHHLLELT